MSNLSDRLRGKYAIGNGNPPEFGYRQFDIPPIQVEAADSIEALEAERDALLARVAELEDALDTLLAVIRQLRITESGDES